MRQIVDIKKCRKNMLDKKVMEHLLKSEEDIEKNRTRKATEVMKEFKTKYGF